MKRTVLIIYEKYALESLLGECSCELPQTNGVDDIEMMLSTTTLSESAIMGGVSSQTDERSPASTGPLYCLTYMDVTRKRAFDGSSRLNQ